MIFESDLRSLQATVTFRNKGEDFEDFEVRFGGSLLDLSDVFSFMG